jgi:choline kinase
MPAVKHAVITAAGVGSRLGMNMPKCLVEIGGKRIIDYQLELLRDVEDLRIVVGFRRDDVIRHVKTARPDALFVCNHQYATTTTLQSLYLGVNSLREPFLCIDGDVVPEPESFRRFLTACESSMPLTAISRAASTDAVYAVVDPRVTVVKALVRAPESEWEWPGISYLDPSMVEDKKTFVYQQLEQWLPIPVTPLVCWEIDTPEDLARVSAEFIDVSARSKHPR